MPVDARVLELLREITPAGAPRAWELPPPIVRAARDAAPGYAGPPAEGVVCEDRLLTNIPVRIYRSVEGVRPCLLFYHGGGWTLGSIKNYHTVCSRIAKESGWTVVSVEYRLAPEHKYPTPLLDCWMALLQAAQQSAALRIDADCMAVAGDSAGGNLSAAVALMTREYGSPKLAAQVLIYPSVEVTPADIACARPSYQHDYLLNHAGCVQFWRNYLHHADEGSHPWVAPLMANDHAGLPAALIISAEFDPLLDEGDSYAAKLRAAGVPVQLTRYAGMVHAFINMGGHVPQANEALVEIGLFLKGIR